MSHRVFLQPCQLNGVLKCCHDYLVVLQQFLRRSLVFLSFIAIKYLQIASRHFEQTNRMFLKEWLNLTSNIVGIFRVCTWAKGKSVFFQPLIQKTWNGISAFSSRFSGLNSFRVLSSIASARFYCPLRQVRCWWICFSVYCQHLSSLISSGNIHFVLSGGLLPSSFLLFAAAIFTRCWRYHRTINQ